MSVPDPSTDAGQAITPAVALETIQSARDTLRSAIEAIEQRGRAERARHDANDRTAAVHENHPRGVLTAGADDQRADLGRELVQLLEDAARALSYLAVEQTHVPDVGPRTDNLADAAQGVYDITLDAIAHFDRTMGGHV